MPTFNVALVTAAAPVTPVMVDGPVAVRVKSAGTFTPPNVLMTVLTKVSVGAISVLVIEQVEF